MVRDLNPGVGDKSLLFRAAGPSLTPLGVSGVLDDPKIKLFDARQVRIGENDNFTTADQSVFASVGAFRFLPGARDAALVANLTAGIYSTVVSGLNGTTGNALIEIFELN